MVTNLMNRASPPCTGSCSSSTFLSSNICCLVTLIHAFFGIPGRHRPRPSSWTCPAQAQSLLTLGPSQSPPSNSVIPTSTSTRPVKSACSPRLQVGLPLRRPIPHDLRCQFEALPETDIRSQPGMHPHQTSNESTFHLMSACRMTPPSSSSLANFKFPFLSIVIPFSHCSAQACQVTERSSHRILYSGNLKNDGHGVGSSSSLRHLRGFLWPPAWATVSS